MTIITVAKNIADDFSNGTQRISAITGFLNLFIILSVWQERIGIEPNFLFGSSVIFYILLIYVVGHYERHIKEKLLKNSMV